MFLIKMVVKALTSLQTSFLFSSKKKPIITVWWYYTYIFQCNEWNEHSFSAAYFLLFLPLGNNSSHGNFLQVNMLLQHPVREVVCSWSTVMLSGGDPAQLYSLM